MYRSRWIFVLSLFGLLLILSACASRETIEPQSPQTVPTLTPTADKDDGGVTEGIARVSEIEIFILESFPVQVNVVARGNLPDGCTEIDQIRASRQGDTFEVTITTIRPTNKMCTEALVPFEEVISLDVVGLEAGEYTVNVNGTVDTFELMMDNKLPEEPNMGDEDTSGAIIEDVEMTLSKDDPGSMVVVVTGNLRDGCTEIVDATSRVADGEIAVQIVTERPEDQMCTQALVPFEERIAVDISELGGVYSLTVNDFSTTVDLDALASE